MTLKHDNEILGGLQFFLDAPPTTGAGFGTPVLLSGESGLDGDDFRVYTSVEQAAADEDAGDIDLFALDAITTAFSQPVPPPSVIVAHADGGGGSPDVADYLAALDAVRAVRFVGWCVADIRDAQDQIDVAAGCAARRVGFVIQSSASDLLGATLGMQWGALETLEYVMVNYHPEDGEKLDMAVTARNIAPNADNFSRNWTGRIAAVDPYAAGSVTETQYQNAIGNNVNLLGEFGGRPNWLYPGKMINGRPASEIVSAQWFEVRVKERIANLFDRLDARNLKLPVNSAGQAALRSEIETQFTLGVGAGHFEPGQLLITEPEITEADRDEQRIPIEVALQTQTGAIKILGSVFFSRQPVIED